MKKIYLLSLVFSMLVFLAACSSENEKASNDDKINASEGSKKEDKKDDSISVDKNLLDVEVTIPASMFEGEDIDQAIEEAKKDGIKEAVKNADGSVTYKMSKVKHQEMMKELADGAKKAVEDIKNDTTFTSIQDITYNDSFSEFTMIVDKATYENSMDEFAALGLGMNGMFYQVFDGVKDYKVTVNVKDVSTGEVFKTIVYPDSLE